MTYIEIKNLIAKVKLDNKRKIEKINDLLYLKIYPNGSATWIVRKQINKRTITHNIGAFPEVSIKQAMLQAQLFLDDLIEIKADNDITFGEAFKLWSHRQCARKSFNSMSSRIKNHILPYFGDKPLKDLKAPMFIKAWRFLEAEGKLETIRKLCSYVRSIAIYCVNTGRVDSIHELTKISYHYTFKKNVSHPAVTPQDLPKLFKTIKKKNAIFGLGWHLLLASFYTLLRQGELVGLKWDDIDRDKNIIYIDGERMKTGEPHFVPITPQLDVILRLQPKIGDNPYIFAAIKKENAHANSETVRHLLSRCNLQGIQSAHGIRSIGRTYMAQQAFNPLIAELCLAHNIQTSVQKAYQRYDYLEERRSYMTKWCDYVEMCINK